MGEREHARTLRGVQRAVVAPHKSPGIMMKGGVQWCEGLSNGRGGESERVRGSEREDQLLYTRARVTETERLQYGGRGRCGGKESEIAG
jgi:hypothetical protein